MLFLGQGQFLPWHRALGFLYETALREECGYKGPFPYVIYFMTAAEAEAPPYSFWDWPRDADGSKPSVEDLCVLTPR